MSREIFEVTKDRFHLKDLSVYSAGNLAKGSKNARLSGRL